VWGWSWPAWNAPVTTVAEVPFDVAPQTFIERAVEPQAPSGFWYYCSDPAGYYPWVRTCNRPWTPVSPTPPPGSAPQG